MLARAKKIWSAAASSLISLSRDAILHALSLGVVLLTTQRGGLDEQLAMFVHERLEAIPKRLELTVASCDELRRQPQCQGCASFFLMHCANNGIHNRK